MPISTSLLTPLLNPSITHNPTSLLILPFLISFRFLFSSHSSPLHSTPLTTEQAEIAAAAALAEVEGETTQKKKKQKKNEGSQKIVKSRFINADGSPLPLLVQKSDGGFLYATTDLAAVQQRTGVEGADRVVYVTDAGTWMCFFCF
jgi:hypothetical protein